MYSHEKVMWNFCKLYFQKCFLLISWRSGKKRIQIKYKNTFVGISFRIGKFVSLGFLENVLSPSIIFTGGGGASRTLNLLPSSVTIVVCTVNYSPISIPSSCETLLPSEETGWGDGEDGSRPEAQKASNDWISFQTPSWIFMMRTTEKSSLYRLRFFVLGAEEGLIVVIVRRVKAHENPGQDNPISASPPEFNLTCGLEANFSVLYTTLGRKFSFIVSHMVGEVSFLDGISCDLLCSMIRRAAWKVVQMKMKRWEVKGVKSVAIWETLREPPCKFEMRKLARYRERLKVGDGLYKNHWV